LSLRADNADRRLTQVGKSAGLVQSDRWARFQNKLESIAKLKKYLQETRSEGTSLWDKLRMPHSEIADKLTDDINVKEMKLTDDVLQSVIIDAKYEGYLGKQERLASGMKSLENRNIPFDLDYNKISHLRFEAKERLSAFRPGTLGQASRISGITPADITVIQIHLKKHSK
jgi:tRNA uridine 5-carboxymethylaminomethyl modification enzyme